MAEHVLDRVTLGPLVLVRDKMMALQAAGRRVFRLEAGDTSFDTPEHIRKAIHEALESGKTHYPPLSGLPALREAIWRKVQQQNRLPISNANHVIVTVGGMQGLYLTFASMLESGDEVIIPDPEWGETPESIRRSGGVPVPVVMRPDSDFLYDPEAIRAAITPRTKAIYVNSPQNPVGVMLSEDHLRKIAELAVGHDLLVVSDESYEDVTFDGYRHISIGSLPGMEDRTISVFSLSKTYAMTGLRLGYLATNDEILRGRMRKLLRLTTGGVPSIIQWGALAAISGPPDATRQMTAELEHRRDILFSGLQSIPAFHAFHPQGAFYIWARITDAWTGYEGNRDSWAMTNFLIDTAGIGTSPGTAFGPSGEGYIRFAFTGEREMLNAAITEMQRRFS
jgi:aspartate aminotransferase